MFLVVTAIMLGFCCNTHAENPSQSSQLLRQIDTIPLDGVEGRIDHLEIDVKGKRLFVAALGNDTGGGRGPRSGQGHESHHESSCTVGNWLDQRCRVGSLMLADSLSRPSSTSAGGAGILTGP